MMRYYAGLVICFCAITNVLAGEPGAWKPVEGQLLTRWGQEIDPNHVWAEYPRPQMTRPDWLNLNGLWDYCLTPGTQETAPQAYDGKILVPFCVESALSGVKKPVQPDQAVWYRREFQIPEKWRKQRILLNFGAVDWSATVWVNGKQVGTHKGGYEPFTFDITTKLTDSGPQSLLVKVTDPTDTHWQPRGKQVLKPESIWYTAVTGIWQTVWLEPVPNQYIRGLTITPDVQQSSVLVSADVLGGGHIRIEVRDNGQLIAHGAAPASRPMKLRIPDPKLWSPDSPHLYDLIVTVNRTDTVHSYFGMREVSLGQHRGHTRIFLNGQPFFQYGPLDQGWWPDGLYTAPSDEALRYDLEMTKKLGMNMLRKHVKIEPARLYYHCDQLGLLVWQDMPSGDSYIGGDDPDIKRSFGSANNFKRELQAMIDTLHNHPAIIMWVIFNEGWGQWNTDRVVDWVKSYDPTRLVDNASGWADRGVGDVVDLHSYTGPSMKPTEAHRASVLGEFGGLGYEVPKHLWWQDRNVSAGTRDSQETLQADYVTQVEQVLGLISQGLSAAVYTQTTDVEGEINGLMTYDRAVLKFDPDVLKTLHQRLYAPPSEIKDIVSPSIPKPQSWRYTLDQPLGDWTLPTFDDSAWQTGPGMFGVEDTPGVTLGTSWNTSDIWLRREFELDAPPTGDDLRLLLYHDEDAQVYLNGVEAASVTRWVITHRLIEISDAARAALHSGQNTLAVHCHNNGGGQGIDVGLVQLIEKP